MLSSFAPATPPIIPPAETSRVSFHGTSALKIYIPAERTDSGSIMAMAVAWDLWASTPRYFSIHGTTMVPPPEPKSPFAKPVIIPIKAVLIFFKTYHPQLLSASEVFYIHFIDFFVFPFSFLYNKIYGKEYDGWNIHKKQHHYYKSCHRCT